MGAWMRVWLKRAAIVAVLQVVVALPLLRGAFAGVEAVPVSSSYDLALGSFRRTIELGGQDWTKTFHVSIVVHLEGEETRELARRAIALMPRLRDAVRTEVARVDYLDMGTLRGRERLKAEVKRAVDEVLQSDDVREVLFDRYALE